jgi:hypothetical protein
MHCQDVDNTKCWLRFRETESSYITDGNAKCAATLENNETVS